MHGLHLAAALVLASATATLASCSREAPAPAAAEAPATRTAPPSADGAPRIATSADGVHIEYRVHGSGEPAIVLVHGWSCDANYWNAQVPQLAGTHTVVTLNLAGHGSSGRNRSEWSMLRFGEDVVAVLRAIPNERVILVGHSMGGPVVVEAARQAPDRVIGIIGVDTFSNIGEPAMPPAAREAWLADLRADFIGAVRKFVQETFFTKNADRELVRKVATDMSLAPPDIAIASAIALGDYDIVTPVSEMRVPIVAINSDLRGPTDEARIRAFVPQFRVRTMSGLGHFLMMEDPVSFNRVLAEEIAILTANEAAI